MQTMKTHVAIVMIAAAIVGVRAQQAAPQTSPAGTARIYGRVVDAAVGVRVREATVTLASPGTGGWVATTDDEGRFDFRGLPAGKFTIRVTKGTFVATTFPLFAREALGTELKDGQQLDRGDLRLPRGGVIAGRVADEHGDAAIGAGVQAWRVDYTSPGSRRLVTGGFAETNDLGDFRVYGLRPGTYYVSASFRLMQLSVSEAGIPATQFLGAARGVVPTFYPGTTISSNAQPIEVKAGEEATVGIRLQSASLARLNGRVVDARGQPATNTLVMLNGAGADGALFFNANVAEPNAQGQFTISNVPPGDYRVDVLAKARLEAIGKTGGTARPPGAIRSEFASQPITVNGDVDDLLIRTGLGFEMRGRVLLDGAPAPTSVLEKLQVDAMPLLAGQGISNQLLMASGSARPDGTFVVPGLAGWWLVRLRGLPPGLSLQSVMASGLDVTDDGVEISQDIEGVDIAITTKPTRVTGTVTDANGAPTRDYAVIVFSEDSRQWARLLTRHVVSANPGADGRFTVTGLPAGRYFAAAVAELEQGQWASPEHLQQLRARATSFSLSDGEARTLALVRK